MARFRRGGATEDGDTRVKSFKSSAWITTAVLIGAVSLSGCATKKYVNEQVGMVDTKVQSQDTHLGDQETRMAGLDQTTRDALQRAEAAGKLAEGKFLYSMVLTDDATKFPVNGSTLSEEARSRLTEFANKLKSDNRNVYLEIQGYTDSTGAPAANVALGQQRAEAVRLFLNEQGVALNRMATISYGQDNPIASNDTRDGRAQNRRVVMVVLE